jgi:hypothetical protein
MTKNEIDSKSGSKDSYLYYNVIPKVYGTVYGSF